jgi:hypothetical protein
LNGNVSKMYETIGRQLAEANNFTLATINVTGNLLSYTQNQYGSLSLRITVDSGTTNVFPPPTQFSQQKALLRPFLMQFLSLAPTISLTITDEDGTTPISPSLSINGIGSNLAWKANENHFGMLDIWLPNGDFMAIFRKSGYEEYDLKFDSAARKTRFLGVAMINQKNVALIASLMGVTLTVFLITLLVMTMFKLVEIYDHTKHK